MGKNELVNRELNKSTHSASFCVRESLTQSQFKKKFRFFLARNRFTHTTWRVSARVSDRARERAREPYWPPIKSANQKLSNLHTNTHRLNPSSHRLNKFLDRAREREETLSLSRARRHSLSLASAHAFSRLLFCAHRADTHSNTH